MQSSISRLRSSLHSIPPVNRDGRPWNDEQSSLRRPLPCTVPGLEKDSSSRPPGPTQMSPSTPGEGPVMLTLPPPSWRMTHSSMSSPKLGLTQLPLGGTGVNTHPVAGLQVSVVHALLSLQVMGVKTHPVAGLQVSVVHALLSLQVMGVKTHPVAVLQVSVVHALLSLQVMGVKTHPVAGLQVSLVQALLSLQVMGVNTHPVAVLQVSVVHALLSLQVMGVKTHPVAGLQVSLVQALLSLQVMGVLEQMPVAWLHTSVVHALLSSQTGQRKMKPVWDEPETPPLEQVASATVASNPRTCSIRLTVPGGRLSSWASDVAWNVTVHPVVSFSA